MKRQVLWVAQSAALAIGLSLGAGFALAQDGPMPPAPAPAAKPATDKPASAQTSGDPSATGASQGAAPAPTDTQAAGAAGDPASSTTKIMVPSGTHIPLVLHNAISTRSARPGDPVYFETLYPVMIDGKVVIPAGSYVSGEVTESKRPGRVKGRGELAIKMTNMILPNAYQVNLNATPTGAGTGGGETTNSEGVIVGDSDKKDDAATIAKTTAAGAGIGGITARSPAGAGIGAAAGAAVGLAAVLLTRGPDAELPRGSTVEAVINRSLYLDADKITFTSPGKASDLPGPPNREPVRSTSPF
ncbi:MAG: hypothetical protein ABSC71_08680 [Candidatus Acidiferrales bacterium]|jgi:type IV secretion system protein VirB10